MGILKDPSLPHDVFNTALQLASSLILLSPEWQGESTVQTLGVVCGRGQRKELAEVKLVIGFFQELAANSDLFKEVWFVCS